MKSNLSQKIYGSDLNKSLFNVLLLTFFSILLSLSAQAQQAHLGGMARGKQSRKVIKVLLKGKGDWKKECLNLDVLKNNRSHIKHMAKKYRVAADSVRYVLCYEHFDNNDKDVLQDNLAKIRALPLYENNFSSLLKVAALDVLSGAQYFAAEELVLAEDISKRDLSYFFEMDEEDKNFEEEGRLPDGAPRNGSVHWIYSTLGIAQMGLARTLTLAKEDHILNKKLLARFKNSEDVWDLNNIAQVLASDEKASIEVLFSYLKHAQDTYCNIANLDIKHSPLMLLELHRMGNFYYHAQQRKDGCKKSPLPCVYKTCYTKACTK